jgi:hypothetical protein
MMSVTIDVSELYTTTGTAKLADLPGYIAQVLKTAGSGQSVILTGAGPIWLYLQISHALHGRVKRLSYLSPATGEEPIIIYDHDPY